MAKGNQRGTFGGMLSDLRMIGVWSLALVFCLALGQAVGDEAKPKVKTGTLIIECDGLANDKGEVLAGLYNEADRKSTRLNSSHVVISYAVFCLKKKTLL